MKIIGEMEKGTFLDLGSGYIGVIVSEVLCGDWDGKDVITLQTGEIEKMEINRLMPKLKTHHHLVTPI